MNGDELRERRKRLGLTQEELAHLLGVTRQSVFQWERGRNLRRPQMLALALEAIETRMIRSDLFEALSANRARSDREAEGAS